MTIDLQEPGDKFISAVKNGIVLKTEKAISLIQEAVTGDITIRTDEQVLLDECLKKEDWAGAIEILFKPLIDASKNIREAEDQVDILNHLAPPTDGYLPED